MFPKLSNGSYFLRCTFARIQSGCFPYFSLSSPTHHFNNLQRGDLTFFRLQNCTAINKQILHLHVTLQDLKPKGKRKTGSIDTPPAFPASLGFRILQIPLNSKTTLKPLHFHQYAGARTLKTFPHTWVKNFSWWGSHTNPTIPNLSKLGINTGTLSVENGLWK